MEKKEILVISIVSIIAFLIVFFFDIYESIGQTTTPMIGGEFRQIPHPVPIPIQYRVFLSPLFLIVAIIPISYYFISRKLEKNMKIMLKLISKSGVNGNNLKPDYSERVNKNTILKLLNFNERKVLEKLIDERGEALQSELSQMEGMNKLKAHRAIRNLELRGVIKTENYGKTRRVLLSKDIKNIL